MFESWTKEELITEIKRLRSELYHINMARDLGLPPNMPVPDGHAVPAQRPVSEAPEGWALPADRSGQIPSTPPLTSAPRFGKPWLGAVLDVPNSEAIDKQIQEVADLIKAKNESAEEEDRKEYSGWCLRITDFEGIKFLYLKGPGGQEICLEVDTRPEVNGILNNPQVLTQFANSIGHRNIAGVWPRWWKMQDVGDSFVLRRNGLAYTITTKNVSEENLVRSFFKHLGTIRVKSIDAADGVWTVSDE